MNFIFCKLKKSQKIAEVEQHFKEARENVEKYGTDANWKNRHSHKIPGVKTRECASPTCEEVNLNKKGRDIIKAAGVIENMTKKSLLVSESFQFVASLKNMNFICCKLKKTQKT